VSSLRAIVRVLSIDFTSKVLVSTVGIALIHYMSVAEYATYVSIVSIVAVVAQGLCASLNSVYIVGQRNLENGISPAPMLLIQLGVVGAAALGISPFLVTPFPGTVVCMALALVTCISEFWKTLFQFRIDFKKYSTFELTRSLVFAIPTAAAALAFGKGLLANHVLLIQLSALTATVTLFSRFVIQDLISFHFSECRRIFGLLLKGVPKLVCAYVLLVGLLGQVDVLILQALGLRSELAIYGSALRYYAFLYLAVNSIHVVFLPLFQRIKTYEELDQVFRKHRIGTLAFAIGSLTVAGFSQFAIPLIDQGKYPGAILCFRVLCLSAVISFCFSPHVNLLLRFEDYRFLVVLTSLCLVLHIAMNLVLVRRLGAVGAAVCHLVDFGLMTGSIFVRSFTLRRERRTLPEPPTAGQASERELMIE
jgi:O-antigen/teichoic acid export membrane protein